MFGILLVNVWGFVFGYTGYRYGVAETAISVADALAVCFVAFAAEQKFYPIFAFLFGAGLVLAGRRLPLPDALAFQRRRLRWLLGCGIVHGSLLWLGDILTAYALAGFWLVSAARQRPRKVLRILRAVVLINLLILATLAMLSLRYDADVGRQIIDSAAAHLVYSEGSWGAIARARLADYGSNVFALAIFLPRIVLLMLLGILAARLGYLSRPQRHRAFWMRLRRFGLLAGLPLNAWWAMVALGTMRNPAAPPPLALLVTFMIDLAGPLLAAGYVASWMLARPARWLAPVGRMALSNYLAQSLLLMLLLQGFALGLGARLPRAGLVLLCLPIMLAQLLWSHWWLAHHRMGPLEAWWRAYSERRTPPAMVK